MSENYNDGLAEMMHVITNKEMLKQVVANIASLKDVRDNNIYPFVLLVTREWVISCWCFLKLRFNLLHLPS